MNLRTTIAWQSFLIALVLAAAFCAPAIAAKPPAEDGPPKLRKGHPRLLLLEDDIPRLKNIIETDPLARRWYVYLKGKADKEMSAKPIEHKLIGPRLLDQSRKALYRISLWSAMYRFDGDKRYAERATQEMLTAAAFTDWNPSHFLDVAEMTNALAIGYDWLYDTLSPADRATIRKAIVELGLKEGLKVYQKKSGWHMGVNNWNQVCNGGMTAGALAVAEDEKELSGKIIEYVVKSIPLAMATFGPDGGWPEGPGYWGYATRYNIYCLADLRSALGTDFKLSKIPGFADAGNFRIDFVGPLGKSFDFADSQEKTEGAPQMFWFAHAFHQPMFAAVERETATKYPDLLDLIWYDPAGKTPEQAHYRTDAVYKGVDVAFLRSAWNDPNALYVGFKGGDNRAGHAHLDLGTFVFDAFGQRWGVDLGADEYNMPGYFGKQRFTYYRLSTAGHNTITINGENQDESAKAPIIAWHSSPTRSFAVADLTAAYGKALYTSRRGIEMLDKKRIIVQDEIAAKEPVEMLWNFHTRATVEVAANGRQATLTQGEASITATIDSPPGAKFKVVPVKLEPPQNPDPDAVSLVAGLPEKTSKARIIVRFQSSADHSAAPAVEPLDAWVKAGRMK